MQVETTNKETGMLMPISTIIFVNHITRTMII